MLAWVKCLVLIVWVDLCFAVSPEGAMCAIGMNWFLLAATGEDGQDVKDVMIYTFVLWLTGFILFILLWITHIAHLTWVMLLGYTITMATLSFRNIFGWKSWFLPYAVIEVFAGKELDPIKKIDLSWLPRSMFDPIVLVPIIILLIFFNH